MALNKRKARREMPVELGLTTDAATRAAAAQAIDINVDEHSYISQSGSSKAAAERFTGAITYLRSPAHWWVIGLIALLSLGTFGAGLKYLEESAQRQKTERAASANNSNGESQSWLNAINPFIEPPLPTATPQLSKEYIYAGSRMLAVEDAGANAAPPADLAVWRPSNGFWYVLGGVPGSQATYVQWGAQGDQTVPGDYDGDGKTDFSVFRPSDGNWYVSYSSNGYTITVNFGAGSDEKAQADYDGDGKTDVAVWRPGNLSFHIIRSSDGLPQTQALGQAVDDEPVSADYDGDGKADFAVKSGNSWIIRQSSNNQSTTIPWEQAGDIAVQNDYDGDGKVDIAVWRESIGYWLIRQSAHLTVNGGLRQVQWGAPNDIPVPAFYRR